MPTDLGTLVGRYHRAFNDRDFDVWRELFDEDVDLLVDGMPFHGVDAAVGYGAASVTQFPGLSIASERIVAESVDTIVTEIALMNGDPVAGQVRQQGTTCEICRVREGRIVSCRSYYMPEPAGRADAVRVPARAEASMVAEEQAALRRVATLVARGISQEELFAAVTQETGWLVSADTTSLLRFESDDTITLVAAWSARPADLPIGSRHRVDDELRWIRETGRSWRREPADPPPTGSFVEEARALGLRTFVGVPISVDGRIWGVAFASSTADRPFAVEAESRLAGFTELVATAIANAQARMELRGFAEEQAALRRVATLVARAAPPEEVFAAVAAEVSRVLSADETVLSRYDSDGMHTAVGAWNTPETPTPFPVGTRTPLGGRNVVTQVYETGRPGRIDDFADTSGPTADRARARGARSVVGVPISVEGRLWGVMCLVSRTEPPPADTEARLAGFTELVATAIADAEARAALTASRARIVAAADTTRRRIERDLHDGAQQRLVALALHLRASAHASPPPETSELTAQMDEMAHRLTEVLDELREISRGLHPAALAEGGLRPGLKELARRSAVPVRLDVDVDERLAEPIELAAYYVVAEALTNTAKHADASEVHVRAEGDEGALKVTVHDDGRGGADIARGTGLLGLTDRVEALGGHLSLHSPPGAGTTINVFLPHTTRDVRSGRRR